jgi:hypothetical protein
MKRIVGLVRNDVKEDGAKCVTRSYILTFSQ